MEIQDIGNLDISQAIIDWSFNIPFIFGYYFNGIIILINILLVVYISDDTHKPLLVSKLEKIDKQLKKNEIKNEIINKKLDKIIKIIQ
jgi:p-aminobenzoyl-glutamate transporter AbgT